eukprot:TRINITY_DN23313_c0_g1_i1.p1 TRINITY_DN23313_c0_g1~~TRINITY_DN23313_c0_g1_i1.p1  ORF type:complete len:108 (+),score=36.80 TRINITY_DN23313_c0_g1_i1:51-326(+)
MGSMEAPSLVQARWRVDVTITTSMMQKVLTPVVIMRLELSNGEIKTFELPQSQVHSLRYTLAKMLKDMHYFEKKVAPVSLAKKMNERLVKN